MSDCSAFPLAIRLFGPFELRLHGHPVPCLRSRKGQWLLALLVLRAGRDVERDWLAGTLWPDSPAAAALANLRSSLKEVRRALGEEARRLHSPTLRTLSLDPADADVDVIAFDAAIARNDLPGLEQAVALYRGPLLEGCVEAWAFQERLVREQAYLAALEKLAEHSLARGDPGTAEQHLRRAVAVDPLRESAQRALMRVLAAGGNDAAALLVYRELRLLLQREMATQPDAETRALFEQLRAGARRRAEALPRVTLDRPTALPPRPPAGAHTSKLPIPPTPLLGREKELVAAQELLCAESPADGGSRSRLLTLTGPPGTGKTRLAIEVATDLLEEFEDGIFFVPLAPIRDPGLVLSTIAQALNVRETGDRPLLESVQEHLRPKQALLLLDNFEQVLPAAPVVAELLATAPRLQVLVTSRAALRLRGEQEFPVPPLPVPDPTRLPPTPTLIQYASVELFVQRAWNVQPGFVLTGENAPAAAEICYRLDGLPLAIELAAARIKLFSPHALLGRLTNRLTLLTGGARDLPARQQTLRDAIAWSYDLLADAEKRLFRRLSVFVGGCTLEAAEAVCKTDDGRGIDVLDGVASLVDKSLLKRGEAVGSEPRLIMLETIREHAGECLVASGEKGVIRRQHAQFFLALAESGVGHEQMEADYDNLRAALRWMTEIGEGEAGLRLGGELRSFWEARGYLAEGRERLTELLALPAARPRTATRASALLNMGALAVYQGDYTAAQALFEESLAIRRELGHKEKEPGLLDALGIVASYQGDYESARALHEKSLAIYRGRDESGGIAESLANLARVARWEGDYARAAALYDESLALFREVGPRDKLAHDLRNRGLVANRQGDHRLAAPLFSEGLALYQEFGHRHGIAGCLAGLGGVAAAKAQPEQAARLLGAATALREASGWMDPLDLGEYERYAVATHAQLDETAFAAAWAEGQAMSLEDALAYAMQEPADDARSTTAPAAGRQ